MKELSIIGLKTNVNEYVTGQTKKRLECAKQTTANTNQSKTDWTNA